MPDNEEIAVPESVPLALGRIAKLIALQLVKGEGLSEKVVTLSAVGFSQAEIAELVDITPNHVRQILFTHRKGKKKKAKKKTKKNPTKKGKKKT